jgi:membrane protein CcdC involved in cytochrome C biogenesis
MDWIIIGELLIGNMIFAIILSRKLSRIGYSGLLWFVAILFGGIVPFVLASSLPNRNFELRREVEEALLERQLRQASLPVADGETAVPRGTISDDLTLGGAV